MEISIGAQIAKGNTHNLFLGKAFIGVTSNNDDKTFVLDVGREITVSESDTI